VVGMRPSETLPKHAAIRKSAVLEHARPRGDGDYRLEWLLGIASLDFHLIPPSRYFHCDSIAASLR
jgi:hypothetical protein